MLAGMRPREWFWYPKYNGNMRISFDRRGAGTVYSSNPGLIATIPEIITLTLLRQGFDYLAIGRILDTNASIVEDHMYFLRQKMHATNGELIRKAHVLGLDNTMAHRGLAVMLHDTEKRRTFLDKIDRAAGAICNDLWERKYQPTHASFDPEWQYRLRPSRRHDL